jgi:hypothetical protein
MFNWGPIQKEQVNLNHQNGASTLASAASMETSFSQRLGANKSPFCNCPWV